MRLLTLDNPALSFRWEGPVKKAERRFRFQIQSDRISSLNRLERRCIVPHGMHVPSDRLVAVEFLIIFYNSFGFFRLGRGGTHNPFHNPFRRGAVFRSYVVSSLLAHSLIQLNNSILLLFQVMYLPSLHSLLTHSAKQFNSTPFSNTSFGGVSPERKSGEILRTFFTFVAVKIVMAQLEGVGRGDLGSYNASGYTTLSKFIQEHPLKNNGDAWLGQLMLEDEMLGVRIMEVRLAYSSEDFEWQSLKRVAVEEMQVANVMLMRRHAQSRFEGLLQDRGGGEDVNK